MIKFSIAHLWVFQDTHSVRIWTFDLQMPGPPVSVMWRFSLFPQFLNQISARFYLVPSE